MYNDTIEVANKIISNKDLEEIFQKMDDDMKENIQICKQETIQNEKYEREYQEWTTKSFEGTFKCTFNFYDSTNITVDNYVAFITIYNSRLDEIKDMWVRYRYSYWIQHGKDQKLISQYINMNIYEHKMNIEVNLSSDDKKMDDIYRLIKEKIQNAPKRYNRIVSQKEKIKYKIELAIGMIPSIVICTLAAFVPTIKQVYGMTYVGYPLVAIILGLIIGTIVIGNKLDDLYSTIEPKRKYAGWDSKRNKSVYKDDVDDYVSKSEIIIGKNINNIKRRKEILKLDRKYSSYIPIELLVLVVLSIIVIIL